MTKKNLLLMLIVLMVSLTTYSQDKFAVKTNLLYGGLAYAPNLGLELATSRKTTISLSGGGNFWNLDGTHDNNDKLAHWIIQPEFRYWFCEKFNGHYLGGHALGGVYNIGGKNLPLIFGKDADQFRHKGNFFGAGISYGYHLILSPSFNIEFSIGAGYAHLKYDRFECTKCGEPLARSEKRNYWGPTNAGITLVYLIK